ncbi:OTU domain-containing protein 7B [Chionoecetes opilio]|uniref:ubiquitinyl hydrolase 1 n=1 Tax=Chionoecetes opilio TaxID=41210 RepID=A0A8J4Y2I2_CHIOP|nr:OTU domain-containing protein 7B [Chionoecetes opilio]
MEGEKVAEFISHTQADPILARHILQKVNWDVEHALRLFFGPSHLSGTVRSAPNKFTTSVKPPIAPKPVFDHKPNHETMRLLAETGRQGGAKLAPLPPPRTRKMGALPKIHQEGYGPPSGLPPMTQEVLPITTLLSEPYHPRSGASTRSNNLPPIQKACQTDFCSSSCPAASPSMPSLSRPKNQSSHAKNALLIEKVRGTAVSLQEGQKTSPHHHLHNTSFSIAPAVPQHRTTTITTTPAAAAATGTAIDPSHVTLNSTCIISINNPNNNHTTRNNNIYPDPYSACSDSGTPPRPSLVSVTHTTNTPYGYSHHPPSRDSPPHTLSPAVPSNPPSCIIIPSTPPQETAKEIRDKIRPRERKNSEKSFSKEVLEDARRNLKAVEEGRVEMASSTTSGPSLSAPCSPAKPLLRKTEAVDLEEYDYYKKLSRGISKATDNVNLVSKARSEFAQEIWQAIDASRTPIFIETPVFTFTLPDLSIYSDEFRMFLERDLIETSTLVSLEGAGRLNWWALVGASQRLWPLATTGDGNCLLHAASLGMWGFHDRLLTLRKALYEFLTRSKYSRPLWRRWRWQVTQQNRETDLVYNGEEWEWEWANVLRLASSAPRGGKDATCEVLQGGEHKLGALEKAGGKTSSCNRLSNGFQDEQSEDCAGRVYESLEEIHVLALAHVLRRPIIVVADLTLKDVSGEPLAPIPFGGVYLPLECPPRECQRSPLLLTYDAAHFSALVVMETQAECTAPQLPGVIPVTDCCHELLPIQFVIDPGDDFVWGKDDVEPAVIQKLNITTHDKIGLLNEYLDVTQVAIPPSYLEACLAVDEAESPENYHQEVEKKSSESSFDSDEGPPYTDGMVGLFPGKSKASKQLQTVAKQFGSIGKSMSKKIKKNFGTLSKLGRTGSFRKREEYVKTCSLARSSCMPKIATHQNFILAAEIHTEKRHAYQEEMVRNYLNNARRRFEKDVAVRRRQEEEVRQLEMEQLERQAEVEGPVQCINPGCSMYGTALTSYMCSTCFSKQREQEQEYKRQASSSSSSTNSSSTNNLNSPKAQHPRVSEGPHYGAGKSKFYADLDPASAGEADKIPVHQALSSRKDGTLYLSNSTFYNDVPSVLSYNLAKSQATADEPDAGLAASALGESGPNVAAPTVTSLAGHGGVGFTPVAIDEVGIGLRGEERSESPSQPCITRDCKFYGSGSTSGYCSRCFQNAGSRSVMVQQIKSVQL